MRQCHRVAAGNPLIDLVVIESACHGLGPRAGEVVTRIAQWLEPTRRAGGGNGIPLY